MSSYFYIRPNNIFIIILYPFHNQHIPIKNPVKFNIIYNIVLVSIFLFTYIFIGSKNIKNKVILIVIDNMNILKKNVEKATTNIENHTSKPNIVLYPKDSTNNSIFFILLFIFDSPIAIRRTIIIKKTIFAYISYLTFTYLSFKRQVKNIYTN